MESEGSGCTSVANFRTCLSRKESVGLTLIAQSGFVSLAALALLGLLILRNVYRYKKYAGTMKWSLVQQPADIYMLSLFAADFLQAIGGAMSARWVDTGIVQVGPLCSAQGAIQQVGNTGVALGTMAIALHTFFVVWMRKGNSLVGAAVVVAVQWTFLILWVAIGWSVHRKETYFAPTPYWCWISSDFPGVRIAGDYVWLWLTLLVSLLAYLLLFLWSMRIIVPDDAHCWRLHMQARRSFTVKHESIPIPIPIKRPLAPSMALLAYPIAHSTMLLPLSIVRWLSFSAAAGAQTPLAATVAVEVVYGLFGATNVALFLATRRRLLLFEHPVRVLRERGRGLDAIHFCDAGGDGEEGEGACRLSNCCSSGNYGSRFKFSASPSSSPLPSASPLKLPPVLAGVHLGLGGDWRHPIPTSTPRPRPLSLPIPIPDAAVPKADGDAEDACVLEEDKGHDGDDDRN